MATVLLVGLASAACYAAISATVNGEPSTAPFRGFVALLQPFGPLSQDQARLTAVALTPGAPGRNPALSYQIAACGTQTFRGVLVIGGDARLSHLRGIPALGTRNAASQSSSERLRDLTISDTSTDTVIDLGPVQVIHIQMNDLGGCVSRFSGSVSSQFVGQAQIITGHAAAPVQQQWRLGWWSGPRTSETWPLVGSLPGIKAEDLGEFQALTGLHGLWMRFPQQYSTVTAGGLEPQSLVEEARPELASSTALAWQSTQPLQPVAVVSDTTSTSSWQSWLVAAGIFLGIGGALLASLLYEWARPSQSQAPSTKDIKTPASKGHSPKPAGREFIIAVAFVVLAWIVGSGRRRA
jgi:hypothetical protein